MSRSDEAVRRSRVTGEPYAKALANIDEGLSLDGWTSAQLSAAASVLIKTRESIAGVSALTQGETNVLEVRLLPGVLAEPMTWSLPLGFSGVEVRADRFFGWFDKAPGFVVRIDCTSARVAQTLAEDQRRPTEWTNIDRVDISACRSLIRLFQRCRALDAQVDAWLAFGNVRLELNGGGKSTQIDLCEALLDALVIPKGAKPALDQDRYSSKMLVEVGERLPLLGGVPLRHTLMDIETGIKFVPTFWNTSDPAPWERLNPAFS